MTCTEYGDWVAADLDGLEGAEVEAARAHVRDCPRCQKVRDEQSAARSLLRGRRLGVEAPYGLRTRITAALDEEARRGSRESAWSGVFRWAAVALVSLGAIALVRSPKSVDPVTGAYYRALDSAMPLSIRTSAPAELEAYYESQRQLGIPAHVVDLAGAGFQLLGGVVEQAGGRPVRLSVYSDGKQVIVCDYQNFAIYQGRLPEPGQALFYGRNGLSYCVRRVGDEVCVLVTRMPLSIFRVRLLGRA